MKTKLSEAIELRKNSKPEEAMSILKALLQTYPSDPDINYQMAWTCDSVGKESEAAPYYETAIANGLVEDRVGAMLGLGSTYRCLGEYEKSLKVFDQAIAEFPKERALSVFRALTLFNLGKVEKSVEELLLQLLDTTSDDSIKSYDRAFRFYSDKLNETWK
ncbi:MAG: tetratricopeptide repeat protein [Bdellovibrionaceae bacterium]|nr:tetratricopeptide repeat protein [Pseudobdellovibrionaceae bacterium]